MLAAIFINAGSVVSRYVFNVSFIWSDEVLVFANIISVAVGALVAALLGEHLSIDVVRAYMSAARENWRAVFIEGVTLVTLATAAFASYSALQVVWRSKQVSVAAGWPMWIPHGILFLAFAGLAVIAALRLAARLRDLSRS